MCKRKEMVCSKDTALQDAYQLFIIIIGDVHTEK